MDRTPLKVILSFFVLTILKLHIYITLAGREKLFDVPHIPKLAGLLMIAEWM